MSLLEHPDQQEPEDQGALYDGLLELFNLIQPNATAGFTPCRNGGMAYPDFLVLLARTVLGSPLHNMNIVDLGSGLTTIVAAYCIKRLGKRGKVLAVEHQEKYAKKTNTLIEAHQLQDFACVINAPLTKQIVDGETYLWYDMKQVVGALHSPNLFGGRPIDLLVVDGPPGFVCPLSRFPAIPLLRSSLANRATVLVDDARREDEMETIRRWLMTNPTGVFAVEFYPLRKGACLMEWRTHTSTKGEFEWGYE